MFVVTRLCRPSLPALAGNARHRLVFSTTAAPKSNVVPEVKKVEVFVDDKPVMCDPGMTALQACALAGVEIPRFCYHERLSVAGNCRMCLVEVEKAPKPQASCAMPIMPGMRIKTNSDISRKAREGVMEFLLMNHPLDCPICDQGGECDLQDQSMAFGNDRSRFTDIDFKGKRAVEDKNIGPLVKTIMTRCIQCTRCVRFGNEIAGIEELGSTGRGNDLQIGTYVEKMFKSELSGNIIDICPVGALTSKPYSFTARPWELRKCDSVDIMDAVGSNIVVQHRTNEVMRVIPRVNEEVNEEWIADKTRFAYDGLKNQRLTHPLLRNHADKLVDCTWEDALFTISERTSIIRGREMAALVGPHVNAETLLVLKDLMNRLDCDNLFTEQTFPMGGTGVDLRSRYLFNAGINGIEDADLVLLVGTCPRFEAPIVNARIRKCFLHNDLRIGVVGPADMDLTYDFDHVGTDLETVKALTNGSHPYCQAIKEAQRPIVIVGGMALAGQGGIDGAALLQHTMALAMSLKDKSGDAAFNVLHSTASQVAAMDLGYQPSPDKLKTLKPRFVYMIDADEEKFNRSMGAKDCFIVYQGSHGDKGAAIADVVLPGSAYTEQDGIYVNTEGRSQQARIAVTSPAKARTDWKVVRALGEIIGVEMPYDDEQSLAKRMLQVAPSLLNVQHIDHPTSGVSSVFPMEKNESVSDSRGAIVPPLRRLADYYQTCSISRLSATMAKCKQAVNADETGNPYWKV